MKTYSELITIPTFLDRYYYLRLHGKVADETFGHARYLNQVFYTSPEWKRVRRDIILRDKACDLACEDRQIIKGIYIHHLNPIALEDIRYRRPIIFDPENLVCVSLGTHNAIHYGDESGLILDVPERTPGDTKLW